MAKLVWDKRGERTFELGLDRGVLYLENGTGVVWNGLTGISETFADTINVPIFIEGVRQVEFPLRGEFAATLSAYTYPDAFLAYDGIAQLDVGLFADNQPSKTFGLSYRTRAGNDVSGSDYGYKIHLLYGLTATPNDMEYTTLGDDVSPVEFSWNITSQPQLDPGYFPTAHAIFDSRYMDAQLLGELEDILYGTAVLTPTLPSLTDLIAFIEGFGTILISDNGDGTWTATAPDVGGYITMISATEFQITGATTVAIDANTYTISTT